jgi:hypothetical protein
VARKAGLKEWDYYLVYNDNHAVALTVAKIHSILLVSVFLIDLLNKKENSKTAVRIFTAKRLSLPESSETGDIVYHGKGLDVSFLNHEGERELSLSMAGFLKNDTLEASLVLSPGPKDSMVIATPFHKDKKMFYYNRKIIGMRASGHVRLGSRMFHFHPGISYGLLDWGRGVWPYHTTWYWSAAQGMVCGNLFGFNLGYGFGDTKAATENMLFFNGIASKLENVTFDIPKNKKNQYEYEKPWKITSSDERIEMTFRPIFDRSVKLSVLLLSTKQHHVFGSFTGAVILDDGTIIYLQDFLGFAEKMENRW